jgi:hypothetical protein
MLAVKKQDTERDDAKPSTAGGFGKVLGSIQGLQQRLGDFSYGEVSIAEAKVKMLVKQLALLRDNLNHLVQLKLSVREINRRVSEIPLASYQEANLDSLEKHPQLHAILQAGKLVPLQRLMKGELAASNVVSLKTVTSDPSDHAVATKEAGTKSTVERARSVDKQQPTEAIGSTRRAAGDAWFGDLSPVAGHRIAPRTRETFTTEEEPPSFTIPNEAIAASQDDQFGGQTEDWSFDLHETALTSSESFTTPINFVFPAETVVDPEPLANSFSKTKLPHSEPPPSATITKTPPDKPTAMEAKAAVTAQAVPAKPAAEKAETRLNESKALVPANHDFDQRLMEEVIKNYGDFAVTPNLPATVDTSTKLAPVTDEAAKTATAELAKSAAAAERNLLNVQKSGDLDRQLKKIIKDYGEYDIYQRKAVVNFKTGGIVAFAVLGLVLAVLYLFKAPAAVSTPQTGSVAQPQVAERRNLPEAVKSPATEEHPIGPEAANASSRALTDGKQKP